MASARRSAIAWSELTSCCADASALRSELARTKVREAARRFLPYAVAAPLFGLAPFMLDGVFIGATRTRDMRNMMALSLVIYVAAVFALVPLFGNHGLWLALLVSFVARGVTLGLRYPALERGVISPRF